MSPIESTFKARDIEEAIDIYFYRPLGYLIARASHMLSLTPNAVTVLSIIVGMIAGHFFYYRDFWINAIGIVVLIFSEAMDSADGQLARMTNSKSRFGRILDGFGSNLIFVSIYVHLCLRLMNEGWSVFVFGIAAISGLSHSFQCAMADQYRNAYTFFVFGEKWSELDDAAKVVESYRKYSWTAQPVQKFLMRIYLNYTYQQESLSRNFKTLYATARERFGFSMPQWFSESYRRDNKPLIKYYNFITTNTRMIFLFIALLIDKVWAYFAFEIIVLNAVLLGLTIHQERLNARLATAIEDRGDRS